MDQYLTRNKRSRYGRMSRLEATCAWTDPYTKEKISDSKVRVCSGGAFIALVVVAASAPAMASPYWIITDAAAGVSDVCSDSNASSISVHASDIHNYVSNQNSPFGLTSNAVSASVRSCHVGGSASAAVSLAQGTLHAYATGSEYRQPNFGAGGDGTATAEFFDTLQFNIPGATPNTITHVGIAVHLDGTTEFVTGSGFTNSFSLLIGNPYYNSNYGMDFYGQMAQELQYVGSGSPILTDHEDAFSSSTLTPINGGKGGFDFTGYFNIWGATPEITIQEELEVSGSSGDTVDFSHTATTNLVLPQGTTFTSASGAFLTHPVTSLPVAEPATVSVLSIGLLGLLGLRRRAGIWTRTAQY